MSRLGLVPVLVLLLTIPCQGQAPARVGKEKKTAAKGEKKDPTTRELLQWLEETLDVTPYQSAMTLKEVLDQFTKAFAAKGKDLPIFLDENPFKEENPDAGDLYDTPVKFRPRPRRIKFETALRFALSKIGTNNATFLVRRGCIEITTLERGGPARLLEERVTATFIKRPLAEALEELADMTGATIILDPRVGDKAQTPITARFRNTISLEGAVRLLAEMAGLTVRLDEEIVIFITGRSKDGPRDKQGELRLRHRPLYLALKDLAAWAETTIILDPRAESEVVNPRLFGMGLPLFGTGILDPPVYRAKLPVSAAIKAGTSARAAAAMLAAMVGLEAVPIDNAVFVTTRYIALEMRGQAPKQRLTKPAPSK
jgi:hypothetical protein